MYGYQKIQGRRQTFCDIYRSVPFIIPLLMEIERANTHYKRYNDPNNIQILVSASGRAINFPNDFDSNNRIHHSPRLAARNPEPVKESGDCSPSNRGPTTPG